MITKSEIIANPKQKLNFTIDELEVGDLVYIVPPIDHFYPFGEIGIISDTGAIILSGSNIGYSVSSSTSQYKEFLYQKANIGTKVVLEKVEE